MNRVNKIWSLAKRVENYTEASWQQTALTSSIQVYQLSTPDPHGNSVGLYLSHILLTAVHPGDRYD